MSSAHEMQRVDRELSLELIESPINPAFLHMLSPISDSCDQHFHLEINGELLWQWRTHKLDPVLLFHALQENLSPLGYILSSGSMVRVGQLLKNKVYVISKKMNSLRNGEVRRSLRGKYWATFAIHRDEILKVPADVIHELRQREKVIEEERDELRKEVEGKIKVCSYKPNLQVCCRCCKSVASQFDREFIRSKPNVVSIEE